VGNSERAAGGIGEITAEQPWIKSIKTSSLDLLLCHEQLLAYNYKADQEGSVTFAYSFGGRTQRSMQRKPRNSAPKEDSR